MYVSPPQGLDLCHTDEVLRLRRGVYGLQQAPRLWHEKWESVMKELGFYRLTSDDCVYRRENASLILYVDDIILMSITDIEVLDSQAGTQETVGCERFGLTSVFSRYTLNRRQRWALAKSGAQHCSSDQKIRDGIVQDSEHSNEGGMC